MSFALIPMLALALPSAAPGGGLEWGVTQTIEPPAGTLMFGFAIDLDGDRLLVGSTCNTAQLPCVGRVFVYARTGGTWAFEAELVPPASIDARYYGYQVALDGDIAVVGASGASGDRGTVFVFARNAAGTWSTATTLEPWGPWSVRGFGMALALDGTRLVVGAPWTDDGDNSYDGAGFVYTRTGTTFTPDAILTRPHPYGQAGTAVALQGDLVVLGAMEQGTVSPRGAIHLYTASPWAEGPMLRGSMISAQDRNGALFSETLAIRGDLLLVGAPSRDDILGNDNAGAVIAFRRQNGTWTEENTIVAAGDRFGSSLAIANDGTIVIGAPYSELVYHARYDGQTVTTLQEVAHLPVGSGFGWGVAIDDTQLLVAARLATSSTGGQGAIFVHELALGLGASCTSGTACHSGFCVDGVCCNDACANGDPSDCARCDGVGTNLPAGRCEAVLEPQICRPATGACDVAEVCSGSMSTCPADTGPTPGCGQDAGTDAATDAATPPRPDAGTGADADAGISPPASMPGGCCDGGSGHGGSALASVVLALLTWLGCYRRSSKASTSRTRSSSSNGLAKNAVG